MRTFFALLLVVVPVGMSQAQEIDRLTRPMVTITEPDLMQTLLSDLLILPPEVLSSISLIDITANGFGPDDVVLLNPSGDAHFIGELVPAALRRLVADWTFTADFRYEGVPNDVSSALTQAHLTEDPAAVLAGTCLSAVEQHYNGDNLSLLLSRDPGAFRLEIWGFDQNALRYGGATGAVACEIDRQKFEFAPPIVVTAFRDGDTCVEAWGSEGQIHTRPCAN